jgi:Domain of unknown function (DUF4391)
MNADDLLAALDLPAAASVDRRVPKTLLVENGAPTAADKRSIHEGVEALLWLAALKPTTIGVLEYRDEVREYLEIAVLHLGLRPGAKSGRIIELVHRAVPYPVVLLAEEGERTGLSLAHKRWSLGEAGKTVVDGEVVAVEWDNAPEEPHAAAFRDAVALGRQPRGTLHAVYQGWIDALLALHAARRTAVFEIPASSERRAARREALKEWARLDGEAARLRIAAEKEKQMARRVDLNLELKRVEAAQAAALANL